MHRTQAFILAQLIGKPSARYADLKPPAMEGSRFTYHLKQLIDSGMIEKTPEKTYSLSASGRFLADHFDLQNQTFSKQPAIVVLVACQNKKQEWLCAKRLIHPALNKIGFPRIHDISLGSRLVEQTESFLQKQTGISCKLAYKSHGYISQIINNKVESLVLFHLLHGTNATGSLKQSDDYEFMWQPENTSWSAEEMIPSMPDLINLLEEEQEITFAELEYHL